MVKINLASRPFYNERLVTVAVTVLALIALGLTAFNVLELVSLSARRTELQVRIARDEAAAKTTDTEAAAVTHAVDRAVLNGLAIETSEANTLISARTFSWTTFLSQIEKALPPDVHLVSVAPAISSGQTWITMVVISKKTEDEAAFMDALDHSGAFSEVQPKSEDLTDEGLQRSTIRARYVELMPGAVAKGSGKGGRP